MIRSLSVWWDASPVGHLRLDENGDLPFVYEEALRVLQILARRPLLAGEEGLRVSLAGAQQKVPMDKLAGTDVAGSAVAAQGLERLAEVFLRLPITLGTFVPGRIALQRRDRPAS